MSSDAVRIIHFLACVAMAWLLLLAMAGRSERLRRIRFLAPLLVAGAVLLVCLPVGGTSLWAAVHGIWSNPSVLLLGLVVSGLGERLFGAALLGPADRRATWIFGAVAGTVLYLNSTLMGGVDLYYLGADRRVAVALIAALAAALLLFGHRTGVLLLAALIAFALGLLESPNLWDYVVDPFFWLIGLGLTARECGEWWTARSARRPPASQP